MNNLESVNRLVRVLVGVVLGGGGILLSDLTAAQSTLGWVLGASVMGAWVGIPLVNRMLVVSPVRR